MPKPITKEPAPERANEGSFAIADKLYQQGQQAVDQALTMLKGYLPAQAPSPSARLDAAAPVPAKPSASAEPDIIVPPRGETALPATPSSAPQSATPPAGSPAPEKPKEEGALQQGLEYIKRMPHEAVLAIAGVTAAAWLFSQPKEDDGWVKSSLRTLVRYSGLALLGTWAWQRYGNELMSSDGKGKEAAPQQPIDASSVPDTAPASAERFGDVAIQMVNGHVILWAAGGRYTVRHKSATLTSFKRDGAECKVDGVANAFNLSGTGRLPEGAFREIARQLQASPGTPQTIQVTAIVRRNDHVVSTGLQGLGEGAKWLGIDTALRAAANDEKAKGPKPVFDAKANEWRVPLQLILTPLSAPATQAAK